MLVRSRCLYVPGRKVQIPGENTHIHATNLYVLNGNLHVLDENLRIHLGNVRILTPNPRIAGSKALNRLKRVRIQASTKIAKGKKQVAEHNGTEFSPPGDHSCSLRPCFSLSSLRSLWSNFSF